MGQAPDQVAPGVEVSEADFETGGMPIPEIAPGAQPEVRKLLGSARLRSEAVGKHLSYHGLAPTRIQYRNPGLADSLV